MIEKREQIIIDFIDQNYECSSKEIFNETDIGVSYATLKRILVKLNTANYIFKKGQGKGTKYFISPIFRVIRPINVDQYYEKEIDDREVQIRFSFDIINDILPKTSVFTRVELLTLEELQVIFKRNISQLSGSEFKKEFERLAIDLSWKSSQIEGNTYSLLETEKLLKDRETAAGKTKEEAIMLLNHKDALDFITENPDYINPLSVSKIEDIHSILIKELNVEKIYARNVSVY